MWPGPRSCASALALLLAGAALADAPWKSAAAHSQFDEGRKFQDQALYPFAIDQYQMSLASEPRPDTEHALGECFAAVDQPLLAATHFERYLAQASADAEAWNRLGCMWLKVDRLEEAAAAFRHLQPLDPESGRTGLLGVELKLGEKLYRARDYRGSADHFLAAERLVGTDERSLDGIAKALRALVDLQLPKDAPAALTTALELYDHGLTVGLRDRLVQAFLRAGQPPKLDRRVKKALADPRMK